MFNKAKKPADKPTEAAPQNAPAAEQQQADIELYRQELNRVIDESQANAQRLKRELDRQQGLIAAAFGLEKAAKERLKVEQQELNALEAESRAAVLKLSEAKQSSDRLMQAYNQKLERVKELHTQADKQSAELFDQQQVVKALLADVQRQNFFCDRQQQVLHALQEGRTDELPPLKELVMPPKPPESPAAKSDKNHANADFWEKKQHTSLKLRPAPPDMTGEAAAEAVNKAVENNIEEAPAEADTGEQKKRGGLKTALSYTICILLAVAVALAIRTWVLMPTEVSGTSMSPTLESHDKLLTSPLPYLWGEPQRGDIIVFQAPSEPEGVFYVKRVIGLSGENVQIKDGFVYINGELLDEPYLNGVSTEGYVDTIVPRGRVFVLGDNRTVSHDSRDKDVSCIEWKEIYGKALWRIAPFGSFGSIY